MLHICIMVQCRKFVVMPRMGPGKKLMQVVIDKDLIDLLKRMKEAYNRRTGLSVSFTKYIEGIFASYLKSSSGKEDLKGAISKKR